MTLFKLTKVSISETTHKFVTSDVFLSLDGCTGLYHDTLNTVSNEKIDVTVVSTGMGSYCVSETIDQIVEIANGAIKLINKTPSPMKPAGHQFPEGSFKELRLEDEWCMDKSGNMASIGFVVIIPDIGENGRASDVDALAKALGLTKRGQTYAQSTGRGERRMTTWKRPEPKPDPAPTNQKTKKRSATTS